MSVLYLNLKATYFEQIKAGEKPFEFRLVTPFWSTRLDDKKYKSICLRKGYPKAGDPEREIWRKWNGAAKIEIQHQHFGPRKVLVYAIDVRELL